MSPAAHFTTELRRYAIAFLIVSVLAAAPLIYLAERDADRDVGSSQSGSSLAMVATEAVAPGVIQVPLSGPNVTELPSPAGRVVPGTPRTRTLVSASQTIVGYGTVGITWSQNPREKPGDVQVLARTQTAGTWTDWVNFEYDAEHGPNLVGPERQRARAGTDPFPVGDVDAVQAKIIIRAEVEPSHLRLVIIDPGVPSETEEATPAIAPNGDLTLSAQAATPKPAIFSRAQWGADERLRDPASLRYGTISVGFVHHTVNSNDYTRDDVPELLRGIYAYHTKGRGWSDIGYNFLVDRFGRIWEGRYGGVDRPVVGAHTLGYNEDSFAMSAIGNFETARPTAALLDAYARLFAWKLSLAGIDPGSRQRVDSSIFHAISGHRDADSTACPGRYLYDKLPSIRQRATAIEPGEPNPSSPPTSTPPPPPEAVERVPNLVGASWPDMILRDAATSAAAILETGGQLDFALQRQLANHWAGKDLIVATGDVTGDRVPDVFARAAKSGRAALFPGTTTGALRPGVVQRNVFGKLDLLTGVGDLSGDGRNDLVGRDRASGSLFLYPGNGGGGFKRRVLVAANGERYDTIAGAGDLDADGRPDLIARRGDALVLIPGGTNALGAPRALAGAWAQYDIVAGTGDVTGDRRPDVLARSRTSRLTYVFPGSGDGLATRALGPFRQFVKTNAVSMAGSLDGNAATDVIARNRFGNLVLFANNGGRNVVSLAPSNVDLSDATHAVSVGDWNGDRIGDLIVRQAETGSLFFRAGTGTRTFEPATLMRAATTRLRGFVPVGDMNGDGDPDLLVTSAKTGRVHLLRGDGAAGFETAVRLGTVSTHSTLLGVGFWDGDGYPDVVERTADQQLMLHRGLGFNVRWAPGILVGTSEGFSVLRSVGDANGDGNPDLVGQRQGDSSLWLVPSTGQRFAAPRLLVEAPAGYRLVG